MKRLTEQQIKEINLNCPSDQGVFFQPYGIPDGLKEHVLYYRYTTGGARGGSCYGDEPEAFTAEDIEPMLVLDKVLEVLKPDVTLLEFRKLSDLFHKSRDSHWEYYGNYTNFNIEYLELSKVYEVLGIE